MGLDSPSSLFQKALDLAKTQDFVGAKKTIKLLEGTNYEWGAYIGLIAEQVKAGDLAGAKATVHGAPALWGGGHWVRCLLRPLVLTGDVSGALQIVDKLTSDEQKGFHKGAVIALQILAGDLTGAKETLRLIMHEERHCDRTVSIIVEAEVRKGDFGGAIETAYGIVDMKYRAEVIGTILAVQASTQESEIAERTIAAIADESFRNQVRVAMEQTKSMKCKPIDLLSVSRLCLHVNETFDSLYPPN